jgi:hypothetical protein
VSTGLERDISLVQTKDGVFWLAWATGRGAEHSILVSQSPDMQQWSPPTVAMKAQAPRYRVDFPQLLISPEGQLLLFARQYEWNAENLYLSRSNDGKRWTPMVKMPSVRLPRIHMDDANGYWMTGFLRRPQRKSNDLVLLRSRNLKVWDTPEILPVDDPNNPWAGVYSPPVVTAEPGGPYGVWTADMMKGFSVTASSDSKNWFPYMTIPHEGPVMPVRPENYGVLRTRDGTVWIAWMQDGRVFAQRKKLTWQDKLAHWFEHFKEDLKELIDRMAPWLH